MGVREDIVAYCRDVIGCEYDYTPSGGREGRSYNCSFLSTCAYEAAGLEIPPWQGHQNGDGSQSDWVRRNGHWTEDPSELMPGDLVFFGTSPDNTTHVGVSLGGWLMIDSVPGGGVQERELYGSFVGGGWPLPNLPGGKSSPPEVFGGINMRVSFPFGINVRAEPSTDSEIVYTYEPEETVVIDGMTIANGFCWGSYIGGSSGLRRYVALGVSNLSEVSR